jgi:hypothetical protein
MNGQRLGEIARKMGIGPQWVSVVINSPVALAEMERRLQEQEQRLLEKISEEQSRRLASQVAAMRYRVEIPVHTPTLDRLDALVKGRRERREKTDDGLAEFIIKAVARINCEKGEAPDAEPMEKEKPSAEAVKTKQERQNLNRRPYQNRWLTIAHPRRTQRGGKHRRASQLPAGAGRTVLLANLGRMDLARVRLPWRETGL